MDVNESQIAQLEAELASKDAAIAILLGNISDMEEELEAVDDVIEMYYMMFVQIQNDMNDLESNLMDEINWVNNTVTLPYMDLSYADLNHANLFNANLSNADLSNTDLSYADLRYAYLSNTDLSYADLRYAYLSNANLGYANLRGADLSGANLSGVDLSDVHLMESTSSRLPACPAVLPNDWLCIDIFNVFTLDNQGFHLIGPNAHGDWHLGTQANLSGAYLYGIHFWYFDFSGVDFSNANLNNADLRYSDLSNANLEGASFNLDYSSSASNLGIIYSNTVCPDGTNSDDNGNTCRNNL
jgi:uncharacterized protein YjbI with pentapeptide repeats